MTEATHADIINRVSAVEAKQSEMALQLAAVSRDTKTAVEGVESNKSHFDKQLERIRERHDQTHMMLEKHVVEANTTNKTIIAMGKSVIGVVSFGVALIALLEALGK